MMNLEDSDFTDFLDLKLGGIYQGLSKAIKPAKLNQQDVEKYSEKIRQEIAQKRSELSKKIAENQHTFDSFQRETLQFDQKIANASSTLESLESSWLSSENAYGMEIDIVLKENVRLENEICTNMNVIDILKELVDVKTSLERVNSSIVNKQLAEAAKQVNLLENTIDNFKIENLRIVKMIKGRIQDTKLNIQENIIKSITDGITTSSDATTFTVNISIAETARLDIFDAAKTLGVCDKITTIIYKLVCLPFISIAFSSPMDFKNFEKNIFVVSKSSQDSEILDSINTSQVRSMLQAFVTFLYEQVFTDNYKILLPESLKIDINNTLWCLAISKCFNLETAFEENSWDSLKIDAQEIEREFIQLGALHSNDFPFSYYVINADERYASTKAQEILKLIRSSVLRSDFQEVLTKDLKFSQMIYDDSHNAFDTHFPNVAITEAAYAIIKHMYELCSLGFQIHNDMPKAIFLGHVFTSIGIYCSLRYKAHRSSITKAGYLSILYYNDSLFLAYHLNKMLHLNIQTGSFSESLQNKKLLDKQKFYNKELLACAHKCLLELLKRLHSEIEQFVASSGGFDSASDSRQFEKISNFVKKARFFINSTSRSIASTKDTLSRHVYCMVIGSLINNLFESVYLQIMAVSYISAGDSTALNKICEQILGIEDLIVVENENMGWKPQLSQHELESYIPSIPKFIQLKDIMLLSMSEIRGRFKLGFLDCFENKDDLTNLVQMLFEDSDNRDSLVETLKN